MMSDETRKAGRNRPWGINPITSFLDTLTFTFVFVNGWHWHRGEVSGPDFLKLVIGLAAFHLIKVLWQRRRYRHAMTPTEQQRYRSMRSLLDYRPTEPAGDGAETREPKPRAGGRA